MTSSYLRSASSAMYLASLSCVSKNVIRSSSARLRLSRALRFLHVRHCKYFQLGLILDKSNVPCTNLFCSWECFFYILGADEEIAPLDVMLLLLLIKRAIAAGGSVCLSVRLSHSLSTYMRFKLLKYTFTPHDKARLLIFWRQTACMFLS